MIYAGFYIIDIVETFYDEVASSGKVYWYIGHSGELSILMALSGGHSLHGK